MKKIVLTGGPASGKTTVLSFLKEKFVNQVVFVPEAATMLLGSGFPVPGHDIEWSIEWQAAFQAAVLPLQINLENAYELKAAEAGIQTLVCDRGALDGAAYTPGGLVQFCQIFKLNIMAMFASYEAIIHLESVATAHPELYGTSNNEKRFEILEEAQLLEHKTRRVWRNHPNWYFIEAENTIETKKMYTRKIIQQLI